MNLSAPVILALPEMVVTSSMSLICLLSLSVAAGAGVIAAFAAGCFALTSVGCADVDPPPWVRGRLGTGDLDLFLGICFALAGVALKLQNSTCGLLAAGPALPGLAVRF